MEAVKIERFYLGCLAHASYMVGSEGVAAVIDPQRDVEIYLQAAARNGWKIEHIIETHVHADFVSGHSELANRTDARIFIGAGSGAQFTHIAVKDGDELCFGSCRLRFLQTPGHTLESICILMNDVSNPDRPGAVFTGDTLFVSDVGRPDLSPTHSPEQLAGIMYTSIHEKLLTLPDDIEIFPAHGAGSLCGRQMSSESSSTIGEQRKSNYALQARTSEEFIRLLTDNLPARPEYFARDVDLNRRGAAPLSNLPALAALTAPEVLRLQSEGAVVVDTRPAMQFSLGHVPASIHIGLTGQYASWAAQILGLDTRLIIVGEDPVHVVESQIRLARVGIENVLGYLAGGVACWIESNFELNHIPQVTVQEFVELRERQANRIAILDVRETAERAGGAIERSLAIPLGKLKSRLAELDRDRLMVVHCKGGYRSSIAASILRRAGFSNIANLIGGFDAWRAAGLACVLPEI
jgi:glyoxylase-like metal-dependent hydrolase (beta-lactamase superfamily II)/rhodanese-related sulfurtransferase